MCRPSSSTRAGGVGRTIFPASRSDPGKGTGAAPAAAGLRAKGRLGPIGALIVGMALAGLCGNAAAAAPGGFPVFHARARAGERLTVVFFGASLTWGANASDPNLTSYRARIAERLEREYPAAHFRFFDAAIGGTGSQLGVFRLERDVLARKPDLVFLDFSANDDIYTDTPETLASYEAILRRLVSEAGCPVVVVIFPFKWNVEQGNTHGMKRRDAHIALARAYGVPVGDAIALCQEKVARGEVSVGAIWPFDGAHPGDLGYALFAEAAWRGLEDGIARGLVPSVPQKMLHAPTYTKSARVRLSTLGGLPRGWKVGTPSLTSAWFDALMSRWLDDVTIASAEGGRVEPLRVEFRGSMLMIFGEKTPSSGRYRFRIDGGAPVERDASSRQLGGNVHLTEVLAQGLDPSAEHTLELEPVFEREGERELRLESICVAGGDGPLVRLLGPPRAGAGEGR